MKLMFSSKAKEKIHSFIEKAPSGTALRIVAVHVEGSSFNFRFELEDPEAGRSDDTVLNEGVFTTRLDPSTSRYLEGGTVDWLDSETPGFTVLGLKEPVPADSPKEMQDQVMEAIKTIFDPEIPMVNIHDLGLIYDVNIQEDHHVKVLMTLTAPNCPAAEQLPADVKTKVAGVPGVSSVDVEITFDPAWTPDRMTEAAKLTLNLL